MRLWRFLFPVTVLSLFGILTAWFWLLHTDSGAQWLWSKARNSVPGHLAAQSITGDLGRGVSITGVVLELDGFSASAESIDVAIDLDILPLSLEVRVLRINSVQVSLSPADVGDGTESMALADVLEGLALPFEVLITDLQINNATVDGLLEDRSIEISKIEIAGNWQDELQFDKFHVTASEGSADAVGSLELWPPFNIEVSNQLQLSTTATGLNEVLDARVSATGDLGSVSLVVDTRGIDGQLHGTVSDLLGLVSWNLSISIPNYQMETDDGQHFLIESLELASDGNINEYHWNMTLQVHPAGYERLSISMAGTTTAKSVDFSSFDIDGANIALSATANAKLTEPWRIVTNVQLARFTPTEFLAEWPSSEQVAGHLKFLFTENQLLLESGVLHLIGRDTEVRIDANIDLASNHVESKLAWRRVQWPLGLTQPHFASESGSVLVSGTLDDWRIAGQSSLTTVEFGTGQFVVEGSGNRENLSLKIEEGSVLGGNLQGQVEYSWTGNQQLEAALELKDISVGSLLTEWPGSISGHVAASGQLRPLRLAITLDNFRGDLRGDPLDASGRIDIAPDELLATAISVRHGQSSVSLDGSLYGTNGLMFDLQIDNLGHYLDDSYGVFNASGRLSLAADNAYLHINASSDEIGYQGYRIRGLQVTDQPSAASLIDTAISVDELTLFDQTISDIELQADISGTEQVLTLKAKTHGVNAEIGISGNFEDWDRADESPWTGTLDTLRFFIDGEDEASLVDTTALTLSAQSLNIQRFCIGESPAPYFCARGSWESGGAIDTRIDFNDIPAGLVNAFAATNLDFDQRIGGTISWNQKPGTLATGNADIRLTPGTFRDLGGSGVVVETGPGSFTFNVREGMLRDGNLKLPMPGTGDISGSFSVNDVSLGRESGVEGAVEIVLANIGVATAFTQLVDDATGRLNAQFSLAGTLADPVLTGQFEIVNGNLTYLPLGLRLNDIQVTGNLHPDRSIELVGHFLAGEGRAEITTRADYRNTAATGVEIVLRGNNLTVIDVPDLQAIANTDIQIDFDGESLHLEGSVFIPRASITPHNLVASRVSESSDVMIVAGALPDDETIRDDENQLKLFGQLEVGFGDNVVIDLDIAKASLTGNAIFSWSGDPLPSADGRYDLTGDVQVLGQVLRITEGIIQFDNTPANNPSIRLRAEREIYGNSQIKRAGMLVTGTAQRQTIEPYTEPATTEERAMTLLITGSDFDYEQGVGAVDFGTYITPKLFLSYGIGLFENENIISARYDLSKGFGVKATSGEKSSGFDIIYRIER